MPAVTPSCSQSRIDPTHKFYQYTASMPGKYHAEKRGNNPFFDFFSIFNQLQSTLPARVNELILECTLDLSKYPAHNAFNLPSRHIFTSVNKFQHVVNTNRACVLYSLARIVAYNIAAHKKIIDEHAELKTLE